MVVSFPEDDYTITVRESRLDWLTLTQTHPAPVHLLLRQGQQLLALVDPTETQRKIWHWRQYDGYHCEWLTLGSREDSDILQLSGPWADDWFSEAYPKATNCSRIDLAVTVHVQGEERDWADGYYQQGCDFAKRTGHPTAFSRVTNSAGGSTCYVGARASDLFGRIYNKAAESGEQQYAGCWRWEVECKGDIAMRTSADLAACTDRSARVRNYVYNYFDRRGLRPLFGASDSEMRLLTIRPRTDHATRLHWLSTAVRPAVSRLIRGGYERQVIEALGLDPASVRWTLRERDPENHHHDDLQEET